ncbi:hypothetical protein [Magnetofaba australis]|nr:hypothetical protein [Magnetofaba australis]
MARILHHWRGPLHLTGWLALFGLILLNGDDSYYLARLQTQILWAGSALLALMLLASVLRTARAPMPAQPPGAGWSVLGAVSAFAPLTLFLITGVTTLTLNSASFSAPGARAAQSARIAFNAAHPPPLPADGYYDLNLVALYGQREIPAPIPARVVGKLSHITPEQAQRHLPNHAGPIAMLYRHAIACCAADATPVGVILEGEAVAQLNAQPGNIWISVEGMARDGGQQPRLILLDVQHWREVEKPAKPYLYWLNPDSQ